MSGGQGTIESVTSSIQGAEGGTVQQEEPQSVFAAASPPSVEAPAIEPPSLAPPSVETPTAIAPEAEPPIANAPDANPADNDMRSVFVAASLDLP